MPSLPFDTVFPMPSWSPGSLPDLSGTAKQIKWAKRIRAARWPHVYSYASAVLNDPRTSVGDRRLHRAALATLAHYKPAGWWLDTRDWDYCTIVRAVVDDPQFRLDVSRWDDEFDDRRDI